MTQQSPPPKPTQPFPDNVIDANHGGLIGARLDRVDGPAKVCGVARYSYEYARQGEALYGAIVCATIAKGRIEAIDTAAIEKMPGVRLVLTHANVPRQASFISNRVPVRPGESRFARPRPFLAGPDIRHFGEAVALVVADSLERARAAADALPVRYAAQPPRSDMSAHLDGAYKPERINAGMPPDSIVGDFDAAFAEAPVKIDATYTTPWQNHNPIELWGTMAIWKAGKLTVYTSTQTATIARDAIAATLGLPREQVQVISKFIGGGFGGKLVCEADAILAAHAARMLGEPVKVMMTRQQAYFLTCHRPETIQRIRLGAAADGTLAATGMDVVEHTATYQEFAEQTATPARTLYAAPARRTTHRLVALDIPAPDTMRAPGEAPGLLAYESAMDELADALGIDPIELRIRNEPARDPERGVPFGSRKLIECMREGARRFGWDKRTKPRGRREGDWWIGMGMSAAFRPNYLQRAEARATIDAGGLLRIQTAMTDIGTGSYTIFTQIAAEAMGLEPRDVVMELGDSALPFAPGSGGSWGAASVGSAVLDACEKLSAKLAAGLDTAPRGRAALSAAVRRAGSTSVSADGAIEQGEQLRAYSSASYGAHFAEIAVDRITGETRLRRMLGVFALGRVLNAKTAESQLMGGMIWGLSGALHEETVVDHRWALPVNHDLAEYHVPVHADVRNIEVVILPELEPTHNPLKVKGAGELGICGAGAAIANAVYNACGVRVREFPITLDKVRAGAAR